MGWTWLSVRTFVCHPSTAAEPLLATQTPICLAVCHVIYLPKGAPTQLPLTFASCVCVCVSLSPPLLKANFSLVMTQRFFLHMQCFIFLASDFLRMRAEEMRYDKQQGCIPESNNVDMREMMRKVTMYRSSCCSVSFVPEADFHPHIFHIHTYW